MTRFRPLVHAALFGLAVLMTPPSGVQAQVFPDSTYKADAAILSAGSRAAAIARLKKVPSVGVVNLNIRYVPLFHSDAPDVAGFRISAGKNSAGIKRLRAALAANPATRRALASRGIAIGRVVGVDIYSNGSIRVYII